MPLLLLKLTVTPLLIGGATLAARRWGPAVGGLIVALPLTSGPLLLFLALEHGPAFAAEASVGTLLGLGAIVAFCAAFALASVRGAAAAIVAASAAYALAGVALMATVDWPYPIVVGGVTLAIAVVVARLPSSSGGPSTTAHPAWDLPARMVVGTTLVVVLTSLAPLLGPAASGIVATFPVYVSVLAVFAFHHDGRAASIGVLRGLLLGLFGTVGFYVAVHTLVEPAGIAVAFLAAVGISLGVAALVLPRVRRPGAADVEPEAA